MLDTEKTALFIGDSACASENVKLTMAGRMRDRCQWVRCLVLQEFCCGCSLNLGMTVTAYFMIGTGVILLVVLLYAFISNDYFSSGEGDQDAQKGTQGPLEIENKSNDKVVGGFIFACINIILIACGIIADSILLFAVYKWRERLVCTWALAMLARAACLLAVVFPLWATCMQGGVLCSLLRWVAMLWLAGTGFYIYVIIAAYSLAFQIREANQRASSMRNNEDMHNSIA